jgi:hypothetical protein
MGSALVKVHPGTQTHHIANAASSQELTRAMETPTSQGIRLSLVPLRILPRTGSSGLLAPFCPLAFLLSAYQSGGWSVGAVGIKTNSTLIKLCKQWCCSRPTGPTSANTTKSLSRGHRSLRCPARPNFRSRGMYSLHRRSHSRGRLPTNRKARWSGPLVLCRAAQ